MSLKITIVTVVRNDPSVVNTVASVLAQKDVLIESLVIDGASTDATLRVLEPFLQKITLVSETDAGIYDAMNKGLHLAKGEVVGFLNAGDVFSSDQELSEVRAAFSENSKLDACWGSLDIVDVAGSIKRRWPVSDFESFSNGWMPSHPTFYALKKSLLKIKGFDTQYRLAADYDLMLRGLELEKWQGQALENFKVLMKSGGASQSSVQAWWRHNRESYQAARRADLNVGTFLEFLCRKVGRKWRQLV